MTLAKHGPSRKLPRRLLMTDAQRLPDPVAAASRLPRGSGVALRHYDAPDRPFLAQALGRLCRARGLTLLVAADWRLAAQVGAAGVHLPEAMAAHGILAPLLLRRRRRLLIVACHSPWALARARRLRADAAVLSPVFSTASHPGARGIGAVRFRMWTRRAGVPVLALGGVTPRNLRRLNGAAGFAAISALK